MMNDDVLDREVRDALEPDASTVDRVVRGAMHRPRRPRPVGKYLLAAAGVIAAVSMGTLLLHRGAPGVPPQNIRLTNINDTIVVTPASGAVWLVGGGGRDDVRLPAGTIVVHRSGETR
jgi:hypothetical protein